MLSGTLAAAFRGTRYAVAPRGRIRCFYGVATRRTSCSIRGVACRPSRALRRWMTLLCWALASDGVADVVEFRWDELPALPPPPGETKQPGVAGPFVGVHGDVLIVAGGANFPDKLPWDGGAKSWWDDIWVLEKSGTGAARWIADRTFKLPRKIGYGLSVSTPDGVVCVGGSDAERCYADVFLLSWDAQARALRRVALPALPEPLAFMAGALVGNTLYVAGGQHGMKNPTPSSAFWALDLAKRNRPGEFAWTVLPSWPGVPRILAVAASQRTGSGPEFFLFGGRNPQPGRRTEILTDAYAFDPRTRSWRVLANVGGGAGVSVMAGVAAPFGENEVLVFGGDRGDLFLDLETHDLAIEALRRRLADAAPAGRSEIEREIGQRLAAKREIYAHHPGFGRDVFAYDSRRDAWRVVTRSGVEPRVTTAAVVWDDAIVIPSGEIRPGVRTPAIVRAVPILKQN